MKRGIPPLWMYEVINVLALAPGQHLSGRPILRRPSSSGYTRAMPRTELWEKLAASRMRAEQRLSMKRPQESTSLFWASIAFHCFFSLNNKSRMQMRKHPVKELH